MTTITTTKRPLWARVLKPTTRRGRIALAVGVLTLAGALVAAAAMLLGGRVGGSLTKSGFSAVWSNYTTGSTLGGKPEVRVLDGEGAPVGDPYALALNGSKTTASLPSTMPALIGNESVELVAGLNTADGTTRAAYVSGLGLENGSLPSGWQIALVEGCGAEVKPAKEMKPVKVRLKITPGTNGTVDFSTLGLVVKVTPLPDGETAIPTGVECAPLGTP